MRPGDSKSLRASARADAAAAPRARPARALAALVLASALVSAGRTAVAETALLSDPTPARADPLNEVVLRKELNGYGAYGVVDHRSDILYRDNTGTWHFTVPSEVPLSSIHDAYFRVSLVGGDNTADDYVYTVAIDGVQTAADGNLPHGSPFGGPFTNWVSRDYGVNSLGSAVSITLTNASPSQYSWNWIAIDWIELHLRLKPGTIRTEAGNGIFGYTGDSVPATSAALNFPEDVAVDAVGDLFIADSYNSRIRKVDAATGLVSTVMSNAQGLSFPTGVAIDGAGNLYVADPALSRVLKRTSGGVVSLYASAGLVQPSDLALDGAGNLYIADKVRHMIFKVAPGGVVSTFAGIGAQGFAGDNFPATSARLSQPSGVAVDAAGNVFIADSGNNRIRKVTGGIITTIAGSGFTSYSGDGGQATAAGIFAPQGVAVDAAGNVYLTDANHFRIRRVAANGVITTVAGDGTNAFLGNYAAGTSARIGFSIGVAVDSLGDVFFTDTFNNSRIREIIATSANTPPTAYAGPDLTVEATSASATLVTLNGLASSDPDGDSLSYAWIWTSGSATDPVPIVSLPIGDTTITLTVDDGHGGSATDDIVVHVRDTIGPAITVPANITTEATSSSGAVVTYSVSAYDAVDGSRPVNSTPASGSTFPIGATTNTTTTVNCSSSDTSGHSSTGSFTVTVRDTTAPVIAPHSTVVAEATSTAGAVVVFTPPSSTDAVDGTQLASCLPASASQFAFGDTTVACSRTDAHGNAATSTSFTVRVQDTTAPTITSVSVSPTSIWPPNGRMVAISYSGSATDAVTADPTVRLVSISGDDSTSSSDVSFDQATGVWSVRATRTGAGNGRTYTLTFQATDAAGNSATTTRTVFVPHDQSH